MTAQTGKGDATAARAVATEARHAATEAKHAKAAEAEAAEAESEAEADRAKPVRKPRKHVQKAQPKKHEAEPTHRVVREIVLGGEPRKIGDLVHLDGLDAPELESQGYVLKATKEPDDESSGSKDAHKH